MSGDRPRIYTGFDQYGRPPPAAKPTLAQRMHGKPVVTYSLLGTFVAIYGLELLALRYDASNGTDWFPLTFLIAPDWLVRPWSLITSTLSHGSGGHLFFNGLATYFFGPTMERLMGWKRFTGLFFLSGAVSGVIQVSITGGAALGASGAIMMLIGTSIIIMPKAKIFIFPIPAPIPLWIGGIGIALLDLLGVFSGGTGIGHFAHLSGMAIGLLVGQRLKEDLRRKGLRLSYG